MAPDIPVAFKRTSDGYVYEVFFPAKYLLPIQLKKGYVVGIGLFVNDRDVRDNADAMSPDGYTESALTLTPDGTGCYNNPQAWPAMLLWESDVVQNSYQSNPIVGQPLPEDKALRWLDHGRRLPQAIRAGKWLDSRSWYLRR